MYIHVLVRMQTPFGGVVKQNLSESVSSIIQHLRCFSEVKKNH